MSETVIESEAPLREHWLGRRSAVQSLLADGNPQGAAETLADVTELPADPEVRIIAAEAYGLLNPSAGLEILDAVLLEIPGNEAALSAKAAIEETIRSASASDRSRWVRILTPGERLRRKIEVQNRILALALGIGGTVGIASLMLLVATPSPAPEPPRIMAVAPPVDPRNDIDDEKLQKFEKIPVTSAPRAGEMSNQMITAAAASSLAVVSIEGIGSGVGMADFGNSFGSSMDFGVQGGASAMFFGSKSEGQRFLFVLDASRSMRPNQVKLRNEELQRALNGIRGAQYQVLLFAGGAFFAEEGWGIDPANSGGSHGPTHFVSPHGKYKFSSKSIHDFNLAGPDSDFTPASWKRANSLNIRKSIEFVKKSKLFTGTDWDMALELAHMMKPPPDVIFFMSDGLDSELSVSDILRNSRRNGNPKINVVAMQTDQGAEGFSEIAKGSKGSYTIVNLDGEVLDGFESPKL
ncbi:MAG: tetratricopeptide repeat protein [Verrucomicrobiales bacterium]|nr:tetratricopeptide repeat protein [Verrucomicrobiales bacterium]